MNIKNIILDILFPKTCINCKREGKYICDKCQVFISEAMSVCPNCYNPSFFGETHQNCVKKYGLDGLISMWDYEGLIRRLIHNIKYGGLTHIIDECVESSFKLIAGDINRFYSFLSFLSSDNTYITYVPMYLKREKQRGFNQSELIAKELAKKVSAKGGLPPEADEPQAQASGWNCQVISLLKKIKDTEGQAKLNKEERLKNIKNSFKFCDRPGLSQVLLVDDVFTTGATMKECCEVLKKAGVQKVWGFTLARTP